MLFSVSVQSLKLEVDRQVSVALLIFFLRQGLLLNLEHPNLSSLPDPGSPISASTRITRTYHSLHPFSIGIGALNSGSHGLCGKQFIQ